MPTYNPSGQINLTVVGGTVPAGHYAADGSWNIVVNAGTGGPIGLYHPSGAYNAVVVADPGSPYYAANGSMNVIANAASPSGFSPVQPRGFNSGSTLSPEAVALIARMTVTPNAGRQTLIDNLIKSLKSSGIWTKLDAFYVLAAADKQSAFLNWVQNNYNLTENNGGIEATFTADQGYLPTGVSGWLNSTFNPTTAVSPKFVQDNASMFARSNSNSRSNGSPIIGNGTGAGGAGANINPWNSSLDNGSYGMNCGANVNAGASPGTTVGLFTCVRSDSANINMYKDTTVLGPTPQTSTAPTNSIFEVCGATLVGNSGRQLSLAGWGSFLSSTDIANLSSATSTYLTTVGVV